MTKDESSTRERETNPNRRRRRLILLPVILAACVWVPFRSFYDGRHTQELLTAAHEADHHRLKYLLGAGADPNRIARDFWITVDGWVVTELNALHVGAFHGDVETVRMLLDAGADPTLLNHDGETALDLALGMNSVEVFLLLFEVTTRVPGGRDIIERALGPPNPSLWHRTLHTEHKVLEAWLSEQQGHPIAPLIKAARTPGSSAEVTRLLGSGEDPNQGEAFGWPALIWASGAHGDTDSMLALLDAGADPNICSREGWTPLLAAAQAGHLERAMLLLSRGADIRATERIDFHSALHLAIGHGSVELVDELLKAGADPRAQTDHGRLPHDLVRYRPLSGGPEVLVLLRAALEANPVTADTIHLVTAESSAEQLELRVRVDDWCAVEESGRVRIRTRVRCSNPEVDLAFDVVVIVGGEEYQAGTFWGNVAESRRSELSCTLPTRPTTVTCILRPNAELGAEHHESGRIWGEEIVFEDMHVRLPEDD